MGNIEKDNKKILIIIIFIWFFLQFIYFHVTVQSDLYDSDCYMRLVRVEQLAETGDWYNSVLHRSNAPYGESQHWTRPFDVFLLIGAYILTPIFGFQHSLWLWGIIISPVLGALCLYLLPWITRPFLNEKARRLILLIFIVQIPILLTFIAGRPDHHSLLEILFFVLIGLLFRDEYKWAGLVSAFLLWVSVESMAAIAFVFSILWFRKDSKNMFYYSSVLLLFSTLALITERPPFWLTVEYDKLSIVHTIIFTLTTFISAILYKIKNNQLIYFSLMPIVLIAFYLFPGLYNPLINVDPKVNLIYLRFIGETKPLFTDIFRTIIVGGPLLLCLPYTFKLKKHRLIFACGFLIYIPLTIYQLRWMFYVGVFIIFILAHLLENLIKSTEHLRINIQPAARVILILFFIFLFPLSGALAVQHTNSANGISEQISSPKLLCEWLNHYPQSNVLLPLDYGDKVLYYTKHSIVNTGYHRNGSGILFAYNVMTSQDNDKAYQMLKERNIKLIIINPDSTIKFLYKTEGDSLFKKLLRGKTPNWAKKIEIPGFLIYEIK